MIQAILEGNPSINAFSCWRNPYSAFFIVTSFSPSLVPRKCPKSKDFATAWDLVWQEYFIRSAKKIDDGRKKNQKKKRKFMKDYAFSTSSSSSSSSSSSKKNSIRETKDIKRKQKKLGEEAQIHLSDSPSLSQCRFITVSERYQRWTNRKEKEKNLLNIHRQSSPSVPWEAHQVYL